IEPARNAYDHRAAAGVLEPAHPSVDLDVERLVAVLVELFRAVGHEGKAADRADEPDVARRGRMVEADRAEAVLGPAQGLGVVVEGLEARPLVEDARGVDIGDAQSGLEREALAV